MRARVYRSSMREFECKILDSGLFVTARAKGNLLKEGEIVPGDFVDLELSQDEYSIMSIEPRTTEIHRRLPRVRTKKVTAANVDYLLIVVSADSPSYKRGVVDRFLIRASQWEVTPIIVLSKMDLFQVGAFDLDFERDRVAALNAHFLLLSCEAGPYLQNMGRLRELLKGKTAILMGQSGVGKSRIITELSGREVTLLSQKVGKANKGKHTTTWSEVVDLEGFTLVDSPGVRSFSLEDLSKEELLQCSPDIAEKACQCKFTSCTHEPNAKGCAFYKVEGREGELLFSRLDSYKKILEEVSQVEDWERE